MAADPNSVLRNSYTTNNVSNSAYTVISPAGGSVKNCSQIQITDTSSHLVVLAYGPTGFEIDLMTCAVSGTVVVHEFFPAGTQFQIKAVDTATISSGWIAVSLLP